MRIAFVETGLFNQPRSRQLFFARRSREAGHEFGRAKLSETSRFHLYGGYGLCVQDRILKKGSCAFRVRVAGIENHGFGPARLQNGFANVAQAWRMRVAGESSPYVRIVDARRSIRSQSKLYFYYNEAILVGCIEDARAVGELAVGAGQLLNAS